MLTERVKDLWDGESATAARLAKCAEVAAEATAAGEIEHAAVARSAEAMTARFLGKQQHAVVVGAELLELWPVLRQRPLPDDKDPIDLRRHLVWGLKYVAGSAMDIPEIPLATTDAVIETIGEVLEHYRYQRPAQWQLQGRRAHIAGDLDTVRELVGKIAPTATRYHYQYHCGDCPGCVFLQFGWWLGPDADAAELEEVLAPVLGKRPFPPDPEPWSRVLDLLYGEVTACAHAVKTAPSTLSRAYTRAGRLPEALRQAKRAVSLTKGEDAGLAEKALIAHTAVVTAMGKRDEARALATEVVARTKAVEDAYDRLDAILVAHRALGDDALATEAIALAERLDARIDKKRHVAETRRKLAGAAI
jgi:hypothetical protein